MNTDAPWPTPEQAEARVLGIQTKLHQGNKGARTAGVDGRTALYVSRVRGEEGFLADLRAELKARRFRPLPARERLIPKPGGSKRRLGIPTVTDRVVQAALKLVLEPILEADSQPCSYGFRPGRRAQDAIAESTTSPADRLAMSGSSRATSPPASRRSTTPRCLGGCVDGSPTSGSWR